MDGKPTGASPVVSETTVMLTRSLRPEQARGDRGGFGSERGHGGDRRIGGEKRYGDGSEKRFEIERRYGGERRFVNPGSDKYQTIKNRVVWYVPIAVKLVTQNNDVMKLLGTRTGGIFRKNLRKISEKMW